MRARSISWCPALVLALAVGLAPAARARAQDAPPAADDAATPSAETPGAQRAEDDEVARQLRQRAEIAPIHRAFGIATWASMAITAVFGWIQFADQFGFHGSANETACGTGHAVFQDFCTGFPAPHAIAALTTTALYFTTFGLSFAMPSPLGVSEDVEIHRTLRWFHLAGILLTAVFGAVTANLDTDFGTRQALSVVHQGLAVTTFGLLTAAAAVVVF